MNLRRAALAVALALVAVATLTPAGGDTRVFGCLICGDNGIADALNNLILFAPVGAALHANGVGWRRVLLIGALASGSVELAQSLVVTGRDASPGDVLFNTAGGLAGWGLVRAAPRALDLPAAAARRAARLAAAVAVAASASVSLLLLPAPLSTQWYGQWTARLGGSYAWYRGRVLAAGLGGLPLPNHRLNRPADVRARFLAGDTLRVTALAGPPPPYLAPIFSIFDVDRREMLLVGADGADLVAKVRLRSAEFRLDQPALRLRGALAAVAAGDALDIRFARRGRGWCLAAGDRERCDLGFSPVRGWSLLLAPSLPGWVESGLDAVAAAALLVGVGVWGRGLGGASLAALTALAALAVVPWAAGVAMAPAWGWAGAVAGYAGGALLRARRRRAAGDA